MNVNIFDIAGSRAMQDYMNILLYGENGTIVNFTDSLGNAVTGDDGNRYQQTVSHLIYAYVGEHYYISQRIGRSVCLDK